ncbi:MAG: hypothetical protein HFJ26_03660 [Clostridia bacterium]|nr:hypothetical protein [Clostridia bacterium]
MNYEDFDKLKTMYTGLIELVCYAKETDSEDEKMDCFFKMFQIVRACLDFSPYTHFYTQVLIDIIIKTYNTKVFRSDLLFKSQIGVFIENSKYYPSDIFRELEEDEYTTQILLMKWVQEIDKISDKKHNEYIKFFETMRDLLIENLIEKKTDLKERLELISKYSNNSLVRNLSVPEKLFLYETKRVFDIRYVNTKPAHALFLDTKFKTKYICDTELSFEERRLDVEKIIEIIKEKHIVAEEVYELQNTEEQIRFELFKVIQNNFTINKCENCGRLFIPTSTSNNPNQKGRNDQKYCNNLYLNTGKTCKQIGALNKQKEKVKNSLILKEYNREYKRMHGLHYNHLKEFKEKQFKEWSKKARQLRDTYMDEQLEKFKIELKKLSITYWKK